MKRIVAFIYILTVVMGTSATPQMGDVIYINGEIWSLCGKPIEEDSILSKNLQAVLPEDRAILSCNWEGYTAYWSMHDENLCLDYITILRFDKATNQKHAVRVSADDMRCVFNDYYDKGNIVATWFNGTIRAAKGETLSCEFMEFGPYHEYEQVLTIEQGKVTDRQSYHNRLVMEGFSTADHYGTEKIKDKFPMHIEDYPELFEKDIFFQVKDICLDSLGNLVDCKVTAIERPIRDIKGDNIEGRNIEGLAQEMKSTLKSLRPWETFFINGKYVPAFSNIGFLFRYR